MELAHAHRDQIVLSKFKFNCDEVDKSIPDPLWSIPYLDTGQIVTSDFD